MSSGRDKGNEPAALVLIGDILKWTMPQVAHFPKPYRFGLGARIEGALLDVLDGLVTAQYALAEVRRENLRFANTHHVAAARIAGWALRPR